MKKLLTSLFATFAIIAASAGNPIAVFNHVGVGASVGTTGFSFEAATNITSFVQLRAGVSILPNIKLSDEYLVNVNAPQGNVPNHIDLDAGFGRTQGSVILNVYPIPSGSFYIAAGAYFGGSDLVKIDGHSDDLANLQNSNVEIGDYLVPVDKNGDVKGGLRVKSFRPYIGLGFGRAVPKRRITVNCELGVQFHGKPEIYSDQGQIHLSDYTNDDTIQKIIDNIKVWPVLSIKICGRIF